MVDPVTVAFTALAFLVIVVLLVIFKMSTKETSFEDAYGARALKLLAEERPKIKSTKLGKNKNKGSEKKKETLQEKDVKPEMKNENQVVTEYNSEHAVAMSNSNSSISPVTERPKKERKSKVKKQEDENVEIKQQLLEPIPVEHEKKLTSAPTENKHEQSILELSDVRSNEDIQQVHEKKSRKKNRNKHMEEPLSAADAQSDPKDINEIVLETETVQLAACPSSDTDEGKPKVVLDDIAGPVDLGKFLVRLHSVEDLEQKYLSFFTSYLSDTDNEKKKLQSNLAYLRKHLNEKTKAVAESTEKLNAALQNEKDIGQLQVSLDEEKRKYSLLEQSVRSQLESNSQEKKFLQRISDKLKTDLAKSEEELKKARAAIRSVPPPVDTSNFQKQIELLRTELSSSKNRSVQLEAELSQHSQAFHQLQSEIQNRDRQIEILTQSTALREKQVQDVKAASTAEYQKLEAQVQSTLAAMQELEKATVSAKDEYEKKIETLIVAEERRNAENKSVLHSLSKAEAECERLSTLYANDSEILLRETDEYKKTIAQLQQELDTVRKTNSEKNARLSEELTKKQEMLAAFQKQVDSLKVEIIEKQDSLCQLRDSTAKDYEEYKKQVPELEQKLQETKEKLEALETSKQSEIEKLRDEIAEIKTIRLLSEELPQEKQVKVLHQPNMLSAPQSSEMNAEIEKLKQELEQQRKRNEELRDRNYKVIEVAQQQDKTIQKLLDSCQKKYEESLREFLSETAEVISNVLPGHSNLPTVENITDLDTYRSYLKEVNKAMKQTFGGKDKASQHSSLEKPTQSSHAYNAGSDEKLKILECTAEKYRNALLTVSSAVETIERETAEKQKSYEKKIHELQAELDQYRDSVSSKIHLLERNTQLGEQVQTLKKQLEGERKNENILRQQSDKLRILVEDLKSNDKDGQESERSESNSADFQSHNKALVEGKMDSSSSNRSAEEEWEVVDS